MPSSRMGQLVIGLPQVSTAAGAPHPPNPRPHPPTQSRAFSSDLQRWAGARTLLVSCLAPIPVARKFHQGAQVSTDPLGSSWPWGCV